MSKKSSYLLALVLAASVVGCQGQTAVEKKSATTATKTVAKSDNQSPIHLNREQFLEQVMNYEKNTETWVFEGEKPCLVDFYADWCAPCRITSPILEELAREYAGKINIYKVDIDDEQELAAVFGIRSIPTFLFCPLEGDPTISSGIANTPAATRAMFVRQIEELLLKKGNDSTIL